MSLSDQRGGQATSLTCGACDFIDIDGDERVMKLSLMAERTFSRPVRCDRKCVSSVWCCVALLVIAIASTHEMCTAAQRTGGTYALHERLVIAFEIGIDTFQNRRG